jgi:dienelactone hydrolase
MDDRAVEPFETFDVTTADVSHPVYLGPKRGPGVLLLHEVAGLTTNTLQLAEEISQAGFTVAVPHLFGRVAGEGSSATVTGFVGWLGRCIAREMSCLVMNQPERGALWLSAACRWLAGESPSPRGVGVIGMCATGCYALGAVFDSHVGAVIVSQAATPALRPTSWGVRGGDSRLRDAETKLMALRFRTDWRAARRRVERLPEIIDEVLEVRRTGPDDPTLPTCNRGIEIQTGSRLRVLWADGSGHSVINFHRVDLAVAEVIAFLHTNLDPDT